MRLARSFLLLIAMATASGCTSTSPTAAYHEVSATVQARTGARLRWDRNSEDDRKAQRAVEQLLAAPLGVDAAVQIALVQSPRLRATLEELSIGQADLVQAGLLSNPVFALGRTAWEQEHLDPNLFASVEASFLELLALPLKKRVARAELEATKLAVADAVLELAAQVRTAYYDALAAQQIADVRALVKDATDASAELATRQAKAGTRSALALQAELGLASRAQLDATRSRGAAEAAREILSQKMGVWGNTARWKLPARLPELPAAEVDTTSLESRAVADRLDLRAARHQLRAVEAALTLAKTTRWTGMVQVHVEAGRLRGSRRFSFGPSVGIELPLFDQRQAAVARLEALRRRARSELEALGVDVRSEVRGAAIRVRTARALAEQIRMRLVPIQQSLVALSQQHYDAMLLGAYQLLQAKQAELDSYRESIEALRDYWIARSDLERAVGSRLSVARPSTKGTP